MTMHEQAVQLLRDSLQNAKAEFHEHQWESIEGLVEHRKRLLVVQRTGWGKSSVYFIATKLLREQGYGPTIIISPLISLMRNQIESAAKYGVQLGTINSSNSRSENQATERELINGQLDAVIISPEKLANESFIDDVLLPVADNIGLFVVDEAHCISDWGHDFRPDYKRLVHILSFLPENLPVLATTATANDRVVEDINRQLGDNLEIYRGELTRTSLRLQNIILPHASERLAWLADKIPSLEGTGIIYTATTRDAELVSSWLKQNDILAASYYGTLKGMTAEESRQHRRVLEQQLLDNELKVMVATSALGMGFDKPDLSFVIHYQCPGSVISYYQQVGRAGRAIPEAWGVLFSGSEDAGIQEYFISQAFPSEQLVEEILDVLASSRRGLKLAELKQQVNARHKKIEAALKFLAAEDPAPVIKLGSYFQRTPIEYQLPFEMIHRLSERKRFEWNEMQEYLQHEDCLMLYLAHALDDKLAVPCGKCANCVPEQKFESTYSQELGLQASEFLKHSETEILPRSLSGTSGADTAARFPIYQFAYKFGDLMCETGRVLSRWGDAGWGQQVMRGKKEGYFNDELVVALVDMVNQSWQPKPSPTWVTCVPSLRHQSLVPDFAKRVAAKLGLPFIEAVHKVSETDQQKTMENAFHQCRNLDGTFEIDSVMQGEPVFLIDDAVDSRWTFTIISALLLRNGSGPVFPLALVSTATS